VTALSHHKRRQRPVLPGVLRIAFVLLAAILPLVLCASAQAGNGRGAPRIVEYGPTFRSNPGQVVFDGTGTMWIAESDGVAYMTKDRRIIERRRPDDCFDCQWRTGGIGVGPDGAIWENGGDRLLRFTKRDVRSYDIISTNDYRDRILAFAANSTGIYTTQLSETGVRRFDASGRYERILTDVGYVRFVAAGADGALWLAVQDQPRYGVPVTSLVFHKGNVTLRGIGAAYLLRHDLGGHFAVSADDALIADAGNGQWGEARLESLVRFAPDGSVREVAPLPERITGTDDIAVDHEGAAWLTEPWLNRIARITKNGGITEYDDHLRGGMPNKIAIAPDGTVWFTDVYRALVVGRTPRATYIRIGNGISPENIPARPVVSADGAVWFYESLSWHPRIARISAGGDIEEFRDPLLDCRYPQTHISCSESVEGPPSVMVADGSGVVVTLAQPRFGAQPAFHVDSQGRVTPKDLRDCLVADSGMVCGANLRIPAGITANSVVRGSDGNLWFTDSMQDRIGRITPAGKVTYFTHGLTRWDSGPQYLTAGGDGNLWFTEIRDRVGRITPSGQIREFSRGIPFRSFPGGIVWGRDGNLWFTLYHGNELVRMTPGGAITRFKHGIYPSRGNDDTVDSIPVLDRYGGIWFNEPQGGRIARATIGGSEPVGMQRLLPYAFSDLSKPGAPELLPNERRLLTEVARASTAANRRNLMFARVQGVLILYYGDPKHPTGILKPNELRNGYAVLGTQNGIFDPSFDYDPNHPQVEWTIGGDERPIDAVVRKLYARERVPAPWQDAFYATPAPQDVACCLEYR
jgi:streptogramin lyase